jgi:hypothetical protein
MEYLEQNLTHACQLTRNYVYITQLNENAVAQLVEALCYKPEDRGFHS